ncbi:MAG: hypothetical protein LBE74_08295, partial [Treponema sp.]|nr:hypothetical protein [Treponema sp.]
NVVNANELVTSPRNEVKTPETKEKHLSVSSWRTTNVKPLKGNGGKFTSCFGANRIILENLPKGRPKSVLFLEKTLYAEDPDNNRAEQPGNPLMYRKPKAASMISKYIKTP